MSEDPAVTLAKFESCTKDVAGMHECYKELLELDERFARRNTWLSGSTTICMWLLGALQICLFFGAGPPPAHDATAYWVHWAAYILFPFMFGSICLSEWRLNYLKWKRATGPDMEFLKRSEAGVGMLTDITKAYRVVVAKNGTKNGTP